MTATTERPRPKMKQASVRWPLAFWKEVRKALTDRDTSFQALITELIAEKFGLPRPENPPPEKPRQTTTTGGVQ